MSERSDSVGVPASLPARRVLAALTALLVLTLCAAAFSGALADVDVWWHLAAGRWIVEQGTLPASDPFGVWNADSACARAVLRSQWLGQAALFGAHALAGEAGVEALRTLLLVATAVLVFVRTRHAGAGAGAGAALAAGAAAALLLSGYGGERPQLFSFALLGLALLLAERLHCALATAAAHPQAAGLPYRVLAPYALLLVLWAQLHGGLLLAALALAAFAGGGALAAMACRRGESSGDSAATASADVAGGAVAGASPGRLAFFALLAGVPLLATLANPAGGDSWVCVATFEQGELRERVSEYQRPHTLLATMPNLWVWVACLALLPFGLWRWWARRDFARLAATTLLAGFGVLAYRYVPFFVLAVLPWLAAEVSAALAPRLGRRGDAALVALALVLALVALLRAGSQRAALEAAAETRFPVAAVALLQTGGVEGRLFTTLGWGGYVLWQLHPRITPNIDGRYLDHRAVAVYTHVLWQTPFGTASWERAGHDLALLPWRSASGQPYPLAQRLLHDGQWRLALQTPHYLLAVRRGSAADARLGAAGSAQPRSAGALRARGEG